MNKNLCDLIGITNEEQSIIDQFRKSDYHEYYWTDDPLYSYSNLGTEDRHYIHGAISFLIQKGHHKTLSDKIREISNSSIVLTSSGLHLYNEIEYSSPDYYWQILQKLYKTTDLIQVTYFPTNSISKILNIHNFQFMGSTLPQSESIGLLESWKEIFGISVKGIIPGESIDFWMEEAPEQHSSFYDQCLQVCQSFLQNGENWKSQLQQQINSQGSFSIYDQ